MGGGERRKGRKGDERKIEIKISMKVLDAR